MTGDVRARVLIEGRVQGVFFRGTTEREARARALRGWVRNLADGRVEAVFQGPRADVDAILAWCRSDRTPGTVTGVEVRWEDPDGTEGAFRTLP